MKPSEGAFLDLRSVMIRRSIPPPQSRFLLHGVPWEAYVLLRDAPENYHVRMTFDRGELEIMSPTRRHERISKLIGRLIEAWADHHDIPIEGCQTMTIRREDLERGLEPDQCYYIENEAAVRADVELDFTKDPPPDLALEVDVSPGDIGKPSLYAALGVPELWRYENRKLSVYRLSSEGTYVPSPQSGSLTGFPLKEAERIVHQLGTASHTALVKSFRQRMQ